LRKHYGKGGEGRISAHTDPAGPCHARKGKKGNLIARKGDEEQALRAMGGRKRKRLWRKKYTNPEHKRTAAMALRREKETVKISTVALERAAKTGLELQRQDEERSN